MDSDPGGGPPRRKGFLGHLGLPEPTPEQRKEALEAPGPSWREYFYYSFLKVWIVLAFFIIDIWIVASWLLPVNLLAIVLSVGVAIYVELLLYSYLWHRPRIEEDPRSFRPSAFRPVFYGRWTPEADRVRAGKSALLERPGPDPKEFM
jgi:hypothetical protein